MKKLELVHEWFTLLKWYYDNKKQGHFYHKDIIIYSEDTKYFIRSHYTKSFLFFIPSYEFAMKFGTDEKRYSVFSGSGGSAVLQENYGINGLVLNKEDVKNDYQYFNSLMLGDFDSENLKILEAINEYFPDYPIIMSYDNRFDEHLMYEN
ncbi:hypothetical protein XaC1_84 [Xanthomonas phage XaC1]|nr:hypothetical protein XaC1_84 [Xanthomonas phage XaC1]